MAIGVADPNIFDPDASKAAASDLIEVVYPLLRGAIDGGTHVLTAALGSDKGESLEAFPMVAAFLHQLELADGAAELFEEACSWACAPLARGMFESLLVIEFIADSDSERRAAAWWVCTQRRRVDYIARFDSRTDRGREFLRLVEQDKGLGGWDNLSHEGIDAYARKVEDFLSRAEYQEASREYARMKEDSYWARRQIPWHALFDGPRSIRDLALRVNRGAMYELTYRQWSEIVHPQNLTRWVRFDGSKAPRVVRLRDDKTMADTAFHIANLLSGGMEAILRYFVPDRLDDAWISADQIELYNRLRAWPR